MEKKQNFSSTLSSEFDLHASLKIDQDGSYQEASPPHSTDNSEGDQNERISSESTSGIPQTTYVMQRTALEMNVGSSTVTREDNTLHSFPGDPPSACERSTKPGSLAKKKRIPKVMDKTSAEYQQFRLKNNISKRRSRLKAKIRSMKTEEFMNNVINQPIVDFGQIMEDIDRIWDPFSGSVSSDVSFGQQSNLNSEARSNTRKKRHGQKTHNKKKREITQLVNQQNQKEAKKRKRKTKRKGNKKATISAATGGAILDNLQINNSDSQSDTMNPSGFPTVQSAASGSSSYTPATGIGKSQTKKRNLICTNTTTCGDNAPYNLRESPPTIHHVFGSTIEKDISDKTSDTHSRVRATQTKRKEEETTLADTIIERRINEISKQNKELRRKNDLLRDRLRYFESVFELGWNLIRHDTKDTK